jgi:hypothetical protein
MPRSAHVVSPRHFLGALIFLLLFILFLLAFPPGLSPQGTIIGTSKVTAVYISIISTIVS